MKARPLPKSSPSQACWYRAPTRPRDAYIINTCTVTAESARKARQFIRRALGANSDAWILVTGCYAQTEADMVAQIKGVDYICGSRNKLSTVQALLRLVRDGQKPARPIICVPESVKAFEDMSIRTFGRTPGLCEDRGRL